MNFNKLLLWISTTDIIHINLTGINVYNNEKDGSLTHESTREKCSPLAHGLCLELQERFIVSSPETHLNRFE